MRGVHRRTFSIDLDSSKPAGGNSGKPAEEACRDDNGSPAPPRLSGNEAAGHHSQVWHYTSFLQRLLLHVAP